MAQPFDHPNKTRFEHLEHSEVKLLLSALMDHIRTDTDVIQLEGIIEELEETEARLRPVDCFSCGRSEDLLPPARPDQTDRVCQHCFNGACELVDRAIGLTVQLVSLHHIHPLGDQLEDGGPCAPGCPACEEEDGA